MKQLKLIAVALVGLLILAFVFRIANRPPDPEFRGKCLSEWLTLVIVTRPGEKGNEADMALIAIGTNAVPYLIRELESRDYQPIKWLVEFLDQEDWNRFSS